MNTSPSGSDPDPSPAELEREFPGWTVFRGVNQMWYARRLQSSPPVVVMDENTTELRAQMADAAEALGGQLPRRPSLRDRTL